jgi:hypothetical protein
VKPACYPQASCASSGCSSPGVNCGTCTRGIVGKACSSSTDCNTVQTLDGNGTAVPIIFGMCSGLACTQAHSTFSWSAHDSLTIEAYAPGRKIYSFAPARGGLLVIHYRFKWEGDTRFCCPEVRIGISGGSIRVSGVGPEGLCSGFDRRRHDFMQR